MKKQLVKKEKKNVKVKKKMKIVREKGTIFNGKKN